MNLRRLGKFLALAVCVALATEAVAGPISVGHLVVVQANGDATGGTTGTANSNAAVRTFVKEFTQAGTLVQTIALPDTAAASGNRALTISGTAAEGFIAQSSNGDYLTLGGYNKTFGGTNPASDASSTTNRVVGRIQISTGNVDTTTSLNNAHSTSNIRAAVSTDGIDFWTGGGGSTTAGLAPGVAYTTLGATTATRINGTPNGGSTRRVVDIINGQLYVSGASTGGPNFSLNEVGSGLPIPTSPSSETNIPGLPTDTTASGHSVYDFFFKDTNTLYLTDDGNAANGGGIQKWTFNGSIWSLQYILLNNAPAGSFVGSSTTSVRGLTGWVSGAGGPATLWATTSSTNSGNNLIRVIDTGIGATATVIATAPTNTAFRGVEYIQVPEPTSLALAGLLAVALAGVARRRR